jgi:hypothetical protein
MTALALSPVYISSSKGLMAFGQYGLKTCRILPVSSTL